LPSSPSSSNMVFSVQFLCLCQNPCEIFLEQCCCGRGKASGLLKFFLPFARVLCYASMLDNRQTDFLRHRRPSCKAVLCPREETLNRRIVETYMVVLSVVLLEHSSFDIADLVISLEQLQILKEELLHIFHGQCTEALDSNQGLCILDALSKLQDLFRVLALFPIYVVPSMLYLVLRVSLVSDHAFYRKLVFSRLRLEGQHACYEICLLEVELRKVERL